MTGWSRIGVTLGIYFPGIGWIIGIYLYPDESDLHYQGRQSLAILSVYLGIFVLGAIYSLLLPANLKFIAMWGLYLLLGLYLMNMIVGFLFAIFSAKRRFWIFGRMADRFSL